MRILVILHLINDYISIKSGQPSRQGGIPTAYWIFQEVTYNIVGAAPAWRDVALAKAGGRPVLLIKPLHTSFSYVITEVQI